MAEEHRTITLVEQQHALDAYLDSLLAEATEPAPEPDRHEAPPVALQVVEPASPEIIESEAPVVEAPAVAPPPVPEEAPQSEPRPEWAEGRFQCLIFRVLGLRLAVPLARLNGILPWDEALTRMPGHAPHFLGLTKAHGETVQVVDTARMVMPADRQPPAIGKQGRAQPSHVILVGQRRWGLVCDGLEDTLTLEPDEVHWRSRRGKRPWLAGTVIEQMCALLDVDALVQLLEQQTPPLDEAGG